MCQNKISLLSMITHFITRIACPLTYRNLTNSLNSFPHNPDLTTLNKKEVQNIVGKGENADNQHFLHFH